MCRPSRAFVPEKLAHSATAEGVFAYSVIILRGIYITSWCEGGRVTESDSTRSERKTDDLDYHKLRSGR